MEIVFRKTIRGLGEFVVGEHSYSYRSEKQFALARLFLLEDLNENARKIVETIPSFLSFVYYSYAEKFNTCQIIESYDFKTLEEATKILIELKVKYNPSNDFNIDEWRENIKVGDKVRMKSWCDIKNNEGVRKLPITKGILLEDKAGEALAYVFVNEAAYFGCLGVVEHCGIPGPSSSSNITVRTPDDFKVTCVHPTWLEPVEIPTSKPKSKVKRRIKLRNAKRS